MSVTEFPLYATADLGGGVQHDVGTLGEGLPAVGLQTYEGHASQQHHEELKSVQGDLDT